MSPHVAPSIIKIHLTLWDLLSLTYESPATRQILLFFHLYFFEQIASFVKEPAYSITVNM